MLLIGCGISVFVSKSKFGCLQVPCKVRAICDLTADSPNLMKGSTSNSIVVFTRIPQFRSEYGKLDALLIVSTTQPTIHCIVIDNIRLEAEEILICAKK